MKLTPRQSEIARLVAHGLTYKEIAGRVGTSPRTIEAHVHQAAHRIGGQGTPKHRCLVWFYRLDPEDRAA